MLRQARSFLSLNCLQKTSGSTGVSTDSLCSVVDRGNTPAPRPRGWWRNGSARPTRICCALFLRFGHKPHGGVPLEGVSQSNGDKLVAAPVVSASHVYPRRRGLPKDHGERSAIAANVLDRQFKADAPNQKWVADFTYIWTAEGWLYAAVVLDLYSRRVVGWSMQASMTSQLVADALMMAVWRRGQPVAVLHHSDQRSQLGFKESS